MEEYEEMLFSFSLSSMIDHSFKQRRGKKAITSFILHNKFLRQLNFQITLDRCEEILQSKTIFLLIFSKIFFFAEIRKSLRFQELFLVIGNSFILI